MARRKITNSQAVCLTLLWGILCYLLVAYSQTINFDVIFAIVASGIIVFVPIYKNMRHRKDWLSDSKGKCSFSPIFSFPIFPSRFFANRIHATLAKPVVLFQPFLCLFFLPLSSFFLFFFSSFFLFTLSFFLSVILSFPIFFLSSFIFRHSPLFVSNKQEKRPPSIS